MSRTHTRLTRPLVGLAAALCLGAVAAPVQAAPPSGEPSHHLPTGPGGIASPGCQVGDPTLFDITFDETGSFHMSYPQDGYDTCDESVVIQTWSSNGVDVDMHTFLPLGEVVTTMSALETAGPAGFATNLPVDPCYTAVTVLRDGDTMIFEDIVGDGCDLTIITDFAGAGHDAEIHVVQQTGVIAPPHFINVDADDTTVLTGLPTGTWYVKVYDGWHVGSSITVDGGAAQPASTVYDVDDGSTVEIDLTSWKLTRLTSEVAPVRAASVETLLMSSRLAR